MLISFKAEGARELALSQAISKNAPEVTSEQDVSFIRQRDRYIDECPC
jgi:hypothetical protein